MIAIGHTFWSEFPLIFPALFAFSAGLLFAMAAQAQENPTPPKFYLVELHGTRPGWPDNMTKAEEAILGEHFDYLKELTAKGVVLMAGPVWGKFGLVVLKVANEEAARAIMDEEPSVVKGLHTYHLSEMVVSLLSDYQRKDRIPTECTDREIYREATIKASLKDVWDAWTSNEGARQFFAPATMIDLRPGGAYEIYFDMSAPPGLRGGEGNRVLSYLPMKMFSFEWNAPPKFGPLRDVRTRVVVLFEEKGADSVAVKFHHVGWGVGADWDEIYAYFDRAWTYVFGNLQRRFAEGPLTWDE